MTLEESRALVDGPLWPKVRDRFLATGTFEVYPAGDPRRIEYLDEPVRKEIALWMKAIPQVAAWRKVIDGKEVRRLRAEYPGVYPDVLRYEAYFNRGSGAAPLAEDEILKTLLKLKFPEAYELCCS